MAILLFYFIVVLAGGFQGVQAGLNTELRSFVGHPVRAALISFCVGTVALFLYNLTIREPWPVRSALHAPWWVWLGGLLGAGYIALTIVLMPRVGAGLYVALAVAGQLCVAVLLDHFGLLGFKTQPISLFRVLGILFLAAGVFLIRRVG